MVGAPTTALDLGRTCQWDLNARLTFGRILYVVTHVFNQALMLPSCVDLLRIVLGSATFQREKFMSPCRECAMPSDPSEERRMRTGGRNRGGADASHSRNPSKKTVSRQACERCIDDNEVTLIDVFTSEYVKS